MVSTLEITLQRKLDLDWPAISVFQRPGEFLPVRSESHLQLNPDELLRFYDPRDYGVALGKALFRDELRDALSRAQAQAREDQESLRILLNVEAEDLKALHWERLCAPLDGGWDFLCLNQATPFSLYLPSLTDRRYPPIGRRDLHALVLIAGPESLDGDYGLAPFDIQTSLAGLRQSLGNIPFDVLAEVEGSAGPPTLESLCERLTAESYSLLHIICHGRVNPKLGSVLYLPDDRRKPVAADSLIERLSRLQGLRGLPHFAFLMACESASPEAENGFGGLGQRLVRELGLPAVLAMTAPISIQTGSELAARFYTRLLAHGEVDRALSEALAGLMGRPDVTVPAIISRLGGRPLFSGALDRPLTASEIQFGAQLLGDLVRERAPVVTGEYETLLSRLQVAASEVAALSASARRELTSALEDANTLSDEIADMSFNALAQGNPLPPYDQRCPFRGLASFRPEDQAFFFGRESLVESLLDRLEAHPFLAVLGPSGSGKSSLVLAGLVPALGKRMPGCSQEGTFAYLTPGSNPVARLETALMAAPDCALVVIDQFEELFTLCRDEAQREAFIQRILALRSSHRLVPTMRADFWGECALYAPLKGEMQAHQELVAPLDAAGLRRAIEQQAAAVGLRFEADLAEDILDDVQGEPGAMPLLQHALLLLWDRRHGRWLRSSEYRAFGGVGQAIAHSADGLYLKLSEPDQERMQAIFLRLTRLDEDPTPGIERRDTRRRVSLDELVPAGGERSAIVELVRRLADARLVVTSVNPVNGQEEVEVAHEALIRYWQRLNAWLEEDRSALRQGERVREAAQQWEESQRGDESLLVHRGGRLDDALELAEGKKYAFNQSEIDYLQACLGLREHERRLQERRRNQWRIASIIAIAVFALLAGIGFYQSNRASQQAATATYALGVVDVQRASAQAASTLAVQQKQTADYNAGVAHDNELEAQRQARIARAGELAAQSQAALTEFPQRSLLLAVEAALPYTDGSEKPPARVLSQLYETLNSVGGRGVAQAGGSFEVVTFSPDGHWLAAGNADNSLLLWRVAEPQEGNPGGTPMDKPIELVGHESAITALAFDPQGRWLLSGDAKGALYLWDLHSQDVQASGRRLEGNVVAILALAFSADGSRFASGDIGATTVLWQIDRDEIQMTKLPPTYSQDPVTSLLFRPDGQRLIGCGNGAVWDVSLGKNPILLNPIVECDQVVASADRRRLGFASNNENRFTGLWDSNEFFSELENWNTGLGPLSILPPTMLDELDKLPEPLAYLPPASTVAVSKMGNFMASINNFGKLRLLSAQNPGNSQNLGDQNSVFTAIAFSPDEHWLISGESNGDIRLWDLRPVNFELPEGLAETRSNLLHGNESAITGLAVSPDSRWLASTGEAGLIKKILLNFQHFDPLEDLRNPETIINDYKLAEDDHTLRLWDLQSAAPNSSVRRIHAAADDLFSYNHPLLAGGDGEWAAAMQESAYGTNYLIELWQPDGFNAFSRAQLFPDQTRPLFFSPPGVPPGPFFYSSFNTVSELLQISLKNGRQSRLDLSQLSNPRLAFDRSGRWLAGISEDGKLGLWDLQSGQTKPIKIIDLAGMNQAGDFRISSDLHWLVSYGSLKSSLVWKIDVASETASAPQEIPCPILNDYGQEFSSDSHWLGLVCVENPEDAENMTVNTSIWDLHVPLSPEPAVKINGRGAFSLQGRWFAFQDEGQDPGFYLMDLSAQGGLVKHKLPDLVEGLVSVFQFSVDEKILAVVTDNIVQIYTVSSSPSLLWTLRGHSSIIRSAVFSPDSRWLATIADEQNILLWNLESFPESGQILPVVLKGHASTPVYTLFTTNGRWLLSEDNSGEIRQWPLKLDDLFSDACQAAGRNLSQSEWSQYFPGETYRRTCPEWPDGQ